MDKGSSGSQDGFATVLSELDSSKARMGKMRIALEDAIRDLACRGRSWGRLHTFEAASKSMNEATRRYRDAVATFNLACGAPPPKAVPTAAGDCAIELRIHFKIQR